MGHSGEGPSIVVLDGYTINPGDNPWDALTRFGGLTVYDRTPPEEVLARSGKASIILTCKVVFTRKILEALPDLQFLSVLATGYNHVDIQAAGDLGIPVSNVPGYSTDSVAQFTFALLLGLCHRVEMHDRLVREGAWSRQEDFCFWKTPQTELAGKTLGIVGLGNIGHRVAELAQGFGMRVLAFNPRPKDPPAIEDFAFVSLEKLFSSSDVVTLHCPLTPENREFVDSRLLGLMKPSAFLLNTARGELIRETDLVHALEQGRIAGAGLDVVAREPISEHSPLLQLPNVMLTPHMAWASRSARNRLMGQTVANVAAYLKGEPINVVNKPFLSRST